MQYFMAIWSINSNESLEKANSYHDQFKKNIMRYKIWDITWILFLVINPITVLSYSFLLNCKMRTVGQVGRLNDHTGLNN